MSKLVQKLIRKEGRGEFAPAFPRPKNLLESFPRPASGGSLFAGAGVLAAVVVVVSLLTWLAPDSDRPVPLDLVDRVLPGVAEQIEEQVGALFEEGKEAAQSAVRNVREGMLGEGLMAARDGISGSSLSVPFPAILQTPGSTPTSSPSSEEPSEPSEPSAPAMDSSLPATPSEPSVPPTEASPTPGEPVAPPPMAEEPPPPAAEESAPPVEEPAPPTAEEPPTTETPPPATDEPPTGAPG